MIKSLSGMKASYQEPENFLCEVYGKILGSNDTFKRHTQTKGHALN